MHTIDIPPIKTKFGVVSFGLEYAAIDETEIGATVTVDLPKAIKGIMAMVPGVNAQDLIKPQKLNVTREELRALSRQIEHAANSPITVEG